jgi:cell division protein FtsW (lipid II flippase)
MQRNVAYVLLIAMLGLIALGLVMLTSTSAVLASTDMSGVYSNLRKQCVWLGLGGVTCVLLSRYDYQKMLRFAPWLLGLACLLLLMCLIPHIGHRINGSPRWLKVAGWTYQPSEFAKVALVLFLSWWMGKYQRRTGEFLRGLVLPIACVTPMLLLMVFQQDFGTTAIMLAIIAAMLFCAGTNPLYLGLIAILALSGLVLTTTFNHERMGRMKAWWATVHHKESDMTEAELDLHARALVGNGNAKQMLAIIAKGDPDDLNLIAERQPQAVAALAKSNPLPLSKLLKINPAALDIFLQNTPKTMDALGETDLSLQPVIKKEQAQLAKGYQQQQALIALGSGGISGLGLGNSRQKMYWLPEVNTDFVFPIIGEELGMWVTLSVVFTFLALILCAGWIAIHAPDPSGVLLGTGLTMMIALQALMNLAVVTSLMPCKGIPLPFISYGGSNLLTCLASIGLLFNLHRQGIYQQQTTPALASASYSVRM